MEDQYVVREKALRMAIRTGVAPDLDFVWANQRLEGSRMCFGSFEPTCDRMCHWYERCRVLSAEPTGIAWRPAREHPPVVVPSSTPSSTAADRWIPPSVRRTAAAIRRRPSLQLENGR